MKIAALLILALFPIAALANVPAADFMDQESAKGIELIGVSGVNPDDQYWHLDGAPGTTPDQMQQAQIDAVMFDWSIHPDPNPLAAKGAILQDANIPAEARVNLFQFAGLLPDYLQAPQAVQQAWQDIVSLYGPNGSKPSDWLTQTVINAVQSDCASNNINLPSPPAPQTAPAGMGGGSNLGGIGSPFAQTTPYSMEDVNQMLRKTWR